MSVITLEEYCETVRQKTPYDALEMFVELSLPEQALRAICSFLPQLVNYVEEDRRFSFKIALGEEKTYSPYGDYYLLSEISLIAPKCEDHTNTIAAEIKKAIKNAVPFCNTFTNVLIRLNSTDRKLEIGVYTTDVDTFRNQDEFLLKHGYTIFAPVNDTSVVATKKHGENREVLYIPLDYGFKNSKQEISDKSPHFYSKSCVT